MLRVWQHGLERLDGARRGERHLDCVATNLALPCRRDARPHDPRSVLAMTTVVRNEATLAGLSTHVLSDDVESALLRDRSRP
jgi:hypothetical protein